MLLKAASGGIGFAGLPGEAIAALVFFPGEIDVGIMGALGRRARADFEIERLVRGFVDELMAVRDTGLEPGGIARPQQGLAIILDEDDLALDYEDEFVFVLM